MFRCAAIRPGRALTGRGSKSHTAVQAKRMLIGNPLRTRIIGERPKRHHSMACGNNITMAKRPQHFESLARSAHLSWRVWSRRTRPRPHLHRYRTASLRRQKPQMQAPKIEATLRQRTALPWPLAINSILFSAPLPRPSDRAASSSRYHPGEHWDLEHRTIILSANFGCDFQIP